MKKEKEFVFKIDGEPIKEPENCTSNTYSIERTGPDQELTFDRLVRYDQKRLPRKKKKRLKKVKFYRALALHVFRNLSDAFSHESFIIPKRS